MLCFIILQFLIFGWGPPFSFEIITTKGKVFLKNEFSYTNQYSQSSFRLPVDPFQPAFPDTVQFIYHYRYSIANYAIGAGVKGKKNHFSTMLQINVVKKTNQQISSRRRAYRRAPVPEKATTAQQRSTLCFPPGLPRWHSDEESSCQCRRQEDAGREDALE